ncbi:MAG TPA: DUF2125 domain-containing protein [Xanthobacteraceae bacterium]
MSVSYRTFDTAAAARPRRRWRLLLPLALVVVLALVWTAFWFYAAARAQTELAAWNQREAAAGRVLSCATQEFGGFPFRFELRCLAPELRLTKAHVSLKTADMHAAVQVYQPTLAIAEFTGPLDAADDNGHAVAVDWTLAQMSVRVRPSAPPERVSLVLDQPAVTRNGGQETVARATHAELHLREAPRLASEPPAFDIALDLAQALLPVVPRVPNAPIDATLAGTLHGLADFSPRPWQQLLRDLQAANGRLDVAQARIRQGNVLMVGNGTLHLTARGALDGELQLTVAGIADLMTALGLDKAVGQASQNALDRVAPGLDLNRLLGSHGNAALATMGANMLGQPTQLEGREAVTLPLRFTDGAVFLGPMKVGEVAPLF